MGNRQRHFWHIGRKGIIVVLILLVPIAMLPGCSNGFISVESAEDSYEQAYSPSISDNAKSEAALTIDYAYTAESGEVFLVLSNGLTVNCGESVPFNLENPSNSSSSNDVNEEIVTTTIENNSAGYGHDYSESNNKTVVQALRPKTNTVTSITTNAAGELVVKYSNGREENLGHLNGEKGDKGEDGRGIENVEIINGHFLITYTDGTSLEVGDFSSYERKICYFSVMHYYPKPEYMINYSPENDERVDDALWCTISGPDYDWTDVTVEIPSEYKGKTVKGIRVERKSSSYTENLIIPSSVIWVHLPASTNIEADDIQNCYFEDTEGWYSMGTKEYISPSIMSDPQAIAAELVRQGKILDENAFSSGIEPPGSVYWVKNWSGN